MRTAGPVIESLVRFCNRRADHSSGELLRAAAVRSCVVGGAIAGLAVSALCVHGGDELGTMSHNIGGAKHIALIGINFFLSLLRQSRAHAPSGTVDSRAVRGGITADSAGTTAVRILLLVRAAPAIAVAHGGDPPRGRVVWASVFSSPNGFLRLGSRPPRISSVSLRLEPRMDLTHPSSARACRVGDRVVCCASLSTSGPLENVLGHLRGDVANELTKWTDRAGNNARSIIWRPHKAVTFLVQ